MKFVLASALLSSVLVGTNAVDLCCFGATVCGEGTCIEEILGMPITEDLCLNFARRRLEIEEVDQSHRELQPPSGLWCPMEMPPVTCPDGMCGGDPHFQKWNGEYFDYHGECDLVFLSAPDFGKGLGLDIHIRTKARFGYSYIESAAVRIGDDVLEVSSHGEYSYNGVAAARLPKNMADIYSATHTQVDQKKHVFNINVKGNENIAITVFKDLVSVNMGNSTDVNYGNSVGLMGSFPDGKMLSRDGKTIMEDASEFGEEWQVLETEQKLFQISRAPQHPQTCNPPQPKKEGRRLGENTISQEAAELACGRWGEHKELCVYDVLAMGDLEIADAGAY